MFRVYINTLLFFYHFRKQENLRVDILLELNGYKGINYPII